MNLIETDSGHVKEMLDKMGYYISIPFMLFSVAGYLIYMIGWPILGGVFVAMFKIRIDIYLANSNKIIWEV